MTRTPFSSLVALLSGLTLAAVACTPRVGLGGADPDADPGDAGTDVCLADAGCSTPPQFSRIDIDVQTVTPADGAETDPYVSVTVSYLKKPATLTETISAPGCSERTEDIPVPGHSLPDHGYTALGRVGVAQVDGGPPVVITSAGRELPQHRAYLDKVPAGASVTITMDPSAPEIGGRTFVVRTRELVSQSRPVGKDEPIHVAPGTNLTVDWAPPVSGHLVAFVNEFLPASRPNVTTYHLISCWAPSNSTTSTIEAPWLAKLHGKEPLFSALNFEVTSSLTASGATVNVFSSAASAGALDIQ